MSDPGHAVVCPACGHANPLGARSCAACGAAFASGESGGTSAGAELPPPPAMPPSPAPPTTSSGWGLRTQATPPPPAAFPPQPPPPAYPPPSGAAYPPPPGGAYPPPSGAAYPPPAGAAYQGPAGHYPAPGAWGAMPQKTSSRPYQIVGGVIALVVAAAVVIALLNHASMHTITEPSSLSGMPQIPSQQLDGVASQVLSQYKSKGVSNAFAAEYGDNSTPQVFLFVLQADSNQAGYSADYGQAFAQGFTQGSGGTLSSPVTKTVGGSQYSCYSGTASQTSLGMCTWLDNNVVGVLIDVSGIGLDQVANEASQARSVTEK